jgi:hypothetical protein
LCLRMIRALGAAARRRTPLGTGELDESGAGYDAHAALAGRVHTFPGGLRRGRRSFASPPRDGRAKELRFRQRLSIIARPAGRGSLFSNSRSKG